MVSKDLLNENDAQLLVLIKTGNELAFQVLYNRYWKRLFVYTINILNDKSLAEDVLHEIFTIIWFKKEVLEIASVESYLFVSAKNKSISLLRKVKFTELDDTLISNLTHTPEVENNLDVVDLNNTLDKIVKKLPRRCKEIFFMSRYDDVSNEEIAKHFNISQRTVENQLYLALKHIKRSLKESVIITFMAVFL